MKNDVKNFVQTCLHCLRTDSGEVIPRPLGHALHASSPNELIHFDFCYMRHSETKHVYVLIIKDDLSGYIWLRPCAEANAETTSEHLIDWFASFGVSDAWISDQGSHFRNKLIESIRNNLKCRHHFTLPYCPWSNGTVEVV